MLNCSFEDARFQGHHRDGDSHLRMLKIQKGKIYNLVIEIVETLLETGRGTGRGIEIGEGILEVTGEEMIAREISGLFIILFSSAFFY